VLRMAARAEGAKSGRPRAALARRDVMAARAGAVVVVLLAFAAAGDRGPGRLADAFTAGILTAGGAEPLVDAWINPPDYTGAPPACAARPPCACATTMAAIACATRRCRRMSTRRPERSTATRC